MFLQKHSNGIKYYPKVIQKSEEIHCFCDTTKDSSDTQYFYEQLEGDVGQVEIELLGSDEIYDICFFNEGSWQMKCLCIGGMNED